MQSGFIVDVYNPFAKNSNVIASFKINGHDFCIRKIDEFEWGQPIFPERPINDNFIHYFVYDTEEEARTFIRQLKHLEGKIKI